MVIDRVLPRDEAGWLRATALALAVDERRKGTLRTNPDERILAWVRRILGPTVACWGDSFVQIGDGYRNLHKDCVDMLEPAGADRRGRYLVVRFALYLQDCVRSSGGLEVRRRSHRLADFASGPLVHVESRLGDLVIFKLTTTHAGNAVRRRGTSVSGRADRR